MPQTRQKKIRQIKIKQWIYPSAIINSIIINNAHNAYNEIKYAKYICVVRLNIEKELAGNVRSVVPPFPHTAAIDMVSSSKPAVPATRAGIGSKSAIQEIECELSHITARFFGGEQSEFAYSVACAVLLRRSGSYSHG
jgi:hypothetical protein